MDEDTIREVNQPEKTALAVWDVQKAPVERIFNREEFLRNVRRLIDAARESKSRSSSPRSCLCLAALSRHRASTFIANEDFPSRPRASNSPSLLLRMTLWFPRTRPVFSSARISSCNADNAAITTLVFTGIATELGIESCGRDAYNRGFFAIIAKDGVSSFSRESHQQLPAIAILERLEQNAGRQVSFFGS